MIPNFSETPFFIVGSPRSGTTLLRFILSSHPRLYIPDETGFLPFLRQDPAADLTVEEVQTVLNRIGRLNHSWNVMVTDITTFYNALPTTRLPYVLDALYRQKMAEHGGMRWGDKTPGYVSYILDIDRIFPMAQFVHIIRDGRDVMLSARQKWRQKHWYMDQYYLLQNWAQYVTTGRQIGQTLGDGRYLEIHYEALVQNTEQTLRQICHFLGEEFAPVMLDHGQTARRQSRPGVIRDVFQPVTAASAGRWREQMTAFEHKLADHLIGKMLADLGYEPAGAGPFSATEKTRLWGLAMKYRFFDTLRQILYTTGYLTLNRGKYR